MIKKNILSIITALVILVLSLSNSENFEEVPFLNIPGMDKIAHFMMYFFFMSVIVFENRNNIKYKTNLYLLGLVPLFYGALMELIQLLITITRSGSYFDFLSNAAGIFFSILLCLFIKPVRKILFR